MRNKLILAAVATAAALTSTYASEREALACGGCFSPPPSPTESPTIVTDHRMILTIAKDQSTLYDQIKYQGSPSAFAWVLPISGTVTVGLSADIVFSTLDGITQTSIVAPPRNCPSPPTCNRSSFGAASDSASGGNYADAGASPPGVQVTKQEVVGPYETVQLKATDANALQQWLATNGFNVPPDVQPVVDKYVTEKFDFLALKLIPGKSVQDMRPVRVTTTGASAVLPLRMVAAGTGATVGVSLWVLGEGRYEPQNFPSFYIPTSDVAWDWNSNKSNYAELRAAKTTASNGRGWETESSTILYPQQVESAVTNSGYGGGYPYPGPPTSADAGPQLDPEEQAAQINYDPVLDGQGNVLKTAVQVRTEDLAALFYGIPTASSRVTRIRADLAHAALDADLVMTASSDQAVLSNVRQLTKELNQPLCPVYSQDGGSQIGTEPRDDAAARANGDAGESFSCATGGAGGTSPVWLGAGLGYLALAVVRARRRRQG
jgi:MYXO-CTERM domain-containing protein